MSAECTLQIVGSPSGLSNHSACLPSHTPCFSAFLLLLSASPLICLSASFAMPATAVMCFTSKEQSGLCCGQLHLEKFQLIPGLLGFSLSFLFCSFFVVLASLFSWFSLLPLTSVRGTRRFFPVFEAEDFLLALRFGPDLATFFCPFFTSSLCCFWISNDHQ